MLRFASLNLHTLTTVGRKRRFMFQRDRCGVCSARKAAAQLHKN